MKHMRFITGFMTAVMLAGYTGNVYTFAAEKETVTSSEAIEASGNSVSVSDPDDTAIKDTTYTYEYDTYSVDYTVTSHWNDRCNVVVDIKNTTDQVIHNWNLTFCTDDEMLGLYNAKIVSEEAVDEDDSVRRITIKNLGYNQDIKADSSVRFGFQVQYSDGFTIPDSFYMSTADTVVDEADYIVENNITSSWETGCTGELQITNTRDTAIEDWVLSVQSESELVNVWGASITKTGENLYELECPEYAQNIDAGKKSVIGYQLMGSDNTIVVMGLRERKLGIDNTISENSASGNSVSENTEEGKYIVLDKEEYDDESGIPVIVDKVDLIKGVLNHAEEVASVSYDVNDSLGDTVKSGTLDITDDRWEAKKIGFSIGENELVFHIRLKNGDTVTESMTVINYDASNLDNTDVDMEDSDGDGIPNYIEKLIQTDKDQIDTDHDGLTDHQEAFYLGYNPLSPDTDDDGIMDKDEDEDGDGITNKEEYDLGSDPLSNDSDLDGLDDALEIEFGTSLILSDTDHDGISDYDEYTLEKIGASHNEDGSYTATFRADMSEMPYDKAVIPTVTLTGDAEGVAGFSMEMVENNPLFDPTMVGYMGHAYEFKTDGSMSGAELTFTYDESLIDSGMLASPDFYPAIYYYNPDAGSLTEVEHQTWTGNSVSVHLDHFSIYILANKADLETFWNRPFDTGLYEKTDSDESKKETGKLILNVNDGDGNPVPDADVLIFRQSIFSRYGNWIMIFDGMDSNTFLMKGRTDKDGKFKCELESKTNDCSGSYTILVDKDGAYGAKARIGAFYGEQFHDGLTEGEVKNVNVTVGKYSGSENANVSFYAYDGKIDGNTAVLYSYNLRLYKGWGITDFDTPVIDTKSPEEAWFKEVFGVEVPCGRYTVEIEKEGFPTKHMEILVTGDLDTPYLVGLGADDNIFETGKTTCDNNQDGLDDELTKLICKGDITTITGTRVFKGTDAQTWEDVYNEIMLLGDDKDGDRLINGKEISICFPAGRAPYLVMYSDPELPDTDHDGIGDKVDESPLVPDPVYIIAWSYSLDTIEKFEKDHVNLFPYLNGDMHTDDWTPSVWDYFEDKDAFSRAARTKQNELIKKGVDPKQIIIQRIDGDMKVINGQIYLRGGNNNLIRLWNQDWSTYADIMELHFYTHGYQGHAFMYNSDKSKLEDPTLYPKLNWNKCGKLYLHGCHTAQIFYDDETKTTYYPLQEFANIQGVVAFGNKNYSNFSSSPTEYIKITDNSQEVYLNTYGVPLLDALRDKEDYVLNYEGDRAIAMRAFSPK